MVRVGIMNVGAVKARFSQQFRLIGGYRGVSYLMVEHSCGKIPDPSVSGEVLPYYGFEANLCWQVESNDVPTIIMYWLGWQYGDVWFSLGNPLIPILVDPPKADEPSGVPVPGHGVRLHHGWNGKPGFPTLPDDLIPAVMVEAG